jgi:hypothetical protein
MEGGKLVSNTGVLSTRPERSKFAESCECENFIPRGEYSLLYSTHILPFIVCEKQTYQANPSTSRQADIALSGTGAFRADL